MFNAERHVEKSSAKSAKATEIYFCVSGGGAMRTPTRDVPVKMCG
jgi:hypothetical protein